MFSRVKIFKSLSANILIGNDFVVIILSQKPLKGSRYLFVFIHQKLVDLITKCVRLFCLSPFNIVKEVFTGFYITVVRDRFVSPFEVIFDPNLSKCGHIFNVSS